MANKAGISRSVLGLIAMAVLGSAGARGQSAGTAPSAEAPVESRETGPDGSVQAGERGSQPGHTSKRTVLHFEDDSIRGDLTRPDGELVQAPRRVSEGSLVRLRRSFTDRALGGAVRGE